MRCWVITIFVVLVWPRLLDCKIVSQSSKVSYEGPPGAAVDMAANPKISIESFRPLIQQKPGEPYSNSKVKGTVSALKNSGKFSSVEVTVKPEADGLHVTFTLEPALYFGMFEFPGVNRRFSYTRLLQVVDIPNQTAYKQETVDKAGDNLHH